MATFQPSSQYMDATILQHIPITSSREKPEKQTVLMSRTNAAAGEGSVVSVPAFSVTALALGATVLTAWGGYGKNSEAGLSMKRVGPLPAVKVCIVFCSQLYLAHMHMLVCTRLSGKGEPVEATSKFICLVIQYKMRFLVFNGCSFV